MIKPNGPRCNLACTYCYYLEKERLYPGTRSFRMPDAVLERFVRDYVASQSRQGAREIWFLWQGGEPTMLGLDFFHRVVELQARHRPPDAIIRNALQTNGTLLDADWVRFFKDRGFLVGISIDGPRELHDRYRLDRRQRPTFDKTMAALNLLREHGVDFNALVVVHRRNSRKAREVYDFLVACDIRFIQFIPLVERSRDGRALAGLPGKDGDRAEARVTPWSVLPNAYGEFLCDVFDQWIGRDVGRIFVQFFDVQLGLWMGGPAALCWFAEACGQALAMEHNGDLYACDHYVYPEYRLGNIMETPVEALAASPNQAEFGEHKRATLPRCCRECEFLFACNGGCPKHRFLTAPDGTRGVNYFCASYKRFFAHAGPSLRAMAGLVRHGLPAAYAMKTRHRRLRDRDLGRNDPCSCGSGKKFKRCCGGPALL